MKRSGREGQLRESPNRLLGWPCTSGDVLYVCGQRLSGVGAASVDDRRADGCVASNASVKDLVFDIDEVALAPQPRRWLCVVPKGGAGPGTPM